MPRTNHRACRFCAGIGSTWAKVDPGERPLCAACSGTPGDVLHAIRQVRTHLKHSDPIRADKLAAALFTRVGARERAAA